MAVLYIIIILLEELLVTRWAKGYLMCYVRLSHTLY